MIVLRASERAETPWKNGLGLTREVAVHPQGAGLDDFEWRVSMARVEAGGPFSRFAGVERRLTVLEGRLRLRIAGLGPVTLGPGSPPVAFPGDVAVGSEVLAGPVLDLNVMTRRGRFTARLESTTIRVATAIAATATTIVLSETDGLGLCWQEARARLDRHDAVRIDANGALGLEPTQPTRVFVVRLERAE